MLTCVAWRAATIVKASGARSKGDARIRCGRLRRFSGNGKREFPLEMIEERLERLGLEGGDADGPIAST
jgi:hypothetical protein